MHNTMYMYCITVHQTIEALLIHAHAYNSDVSDTYDQTHTLW